MKKAHRLWWRNIKNRTVNWIMSLQIRLRRPKADREANLCTGQHISAIGLEALLDSCQSPEERHRIDLAGYCLHDEVLVDIKDLGSISFDGCTLCNAKMGWCNLRSSSFKNCDLRGADLYHTDLSRANLEGADLRDATFEEANLTEARLYRAKLQGVNFENTELARTLIQMETLGKRIRQEQEKDYLTARVIYLKLKENFRSIGAYDAAGWAYIRERTSERHSFAPWRARASYGHEEGLADKSVVHQMRFYGRYLLKWLGALFQEYTWGYGQQPERVLLFCLTILIAFTVIYEWVGGIERTTGMRPTTQDLVLYSLAAFTTNSLPDIVPTSPLAQALTSLEGVFGVAALALFTTALAQRMGGR